MLSSEEFADFERFRDREGRRTKKEAVRELIALGLRAVEDSSTNSKQASPPIGKRERL
jgi:hypothetical protein